MFMAMAEAASLRATCFRGSTGAIIVEDKKHLISMGYNGPPSGEEHCRGKNCDFNLDEGCKRSVHAEANAIYRASNLLNGDLEDCVIYCTHSPCSNCSKLIMTSRIHTVYFKEFYRDQLPLDWLTSNHTHVRRVLPSGLLVDWKTNELLELETKIDEETKTQS